MVLAVQELGRVEFQDLGFDGVELGLSFEGAVCEFVESAESECSPDGL